MWFAVITLFPEMFTEFTQQGIISKAFTHKTASLITVNPRDFVTDNYRRIDNRPYGGGAGMVMMAEPLEKAICFAKDEANKAGYSNVPVVYMSPQGKQLCEPLVQNSLALDGMILLCGRYDGIDERIIETLVDAEWSIGDYVLSGGELPAMVVMDTLIRKLPNVLGDHDSVTQDSFVEDLLDYPQYTKPDAFKGLMVPSVLKSGNHEAIKKWRFVQQYKRTLQRRPDMIEKFKPNAVQAKWLNSLASEY